MKTFAAVLIAALLVPAPARAQSSAEGSIRGTVRDAQGGTLPGVTITLTSPTVPGAPPVVTTDAEGLYRVLNLAPGVYVLEATLQGFARVVREDIAVRAGLNLAIDLEMAIGTLAETITVAGDAPMLEVQNPAQAVNIGRELQGAIPLGSSRKDWYSFLEMTPGVISRSGDATRSAHYMIRGSEVESNRILMDGADMGSFKQGRIDYVGSSTETMEDVQVTTAASDASTPLGVGVVINMATQSGTDALKGSAGMIFTPKSWNGNNNPGGTTATRSIFQTDLSAGGPMIREHAWFFGSYRFSNASTGVSRDELFVRTVSALVPGWEAFDNHSRANFLFLKGTSQLSANHHLSGFYSRDRNPEDQNFVVNASNFERALQGGIGLNARLQSVWGKSLVTSIQAAYNDRTLQAGPAPPSTEGPSQPVHQAAFLSSGRLVGTGQLVLLNDVPARDDIRPKKPSFQVDATYHRSGLVGTHQFKVGVALQPKLSIRESSEYTNGGFAQEHMVFRDQVNAASGLLPFQRTIYDVDSVVNKDIDAYDNAFYLQDAWQPIDRLTLQMGVRLDWIGAYDQLFDVQIQKSLEVGPRLGATYVLTADQKNIVRATWGRVHDQVQGNYISSAGTNRAGQRDLYDLNLDGVFETEFVTPASSARATNREIDPDLRQPHIDEWLVGYRRQLPGQTSVDVSFVRRSYMDRPALVETNGIYDNSVFLGYHNEAFNDIFLITNNVWNWFVYSGVELTATRRTDRLQLMGGFTVNLQHIEGTWQPNDPASFIQPDAFPNDKGLGTIRGNNTNSLSGTADTRNPAWQKYAGRLGLTYNAPWELTLAMNYTMLSGPHSGPVVTRIAAPDPKFGPPTLRLSNGRLVSNPLATTIRFAYADRGENQVQLKDQHLVNLRLGRRFPFGTRYFQAAVDVYNLFNNDADAQFLNGANQLYSPNYGGGRGRVFARSAQLTMNAVF
jgi:outer membrane receptor protein involved in Fe transport